MKTCKYCKSQFEDKKHPNKEYCSRACWTVGIVQERGIPCDYCGKTFIYRHKKREGLKFCSWFCRIRYKDKTFTCKNCGITYRVTAGNKRKFCSPKCANTYNQKPDPSKRESKACKNCGKEFVSYIYRNKIFCSNLCKSKYGARQPKPNARKPENFITKPCMICGNEFTVHKVHDSGKRNSLYCSVSCRNKSHTSAPEMKCKSILESIGVLFEHQCEIKSGFIVDFRIGNIILQVDGEYWHGHKRFEPLSERQTAQKKRDAAQDKYLAACGYKVIRIWESEINENRIRRLLSV